MYPKNAASPPRIAIGPVVQISDGAVQTSGCTVRVLAEGQAEADGGGTTSYSTDGVVCYVPTQAETNYTAFVLIAKKTGCIPASVTVVTTASATAGKVDVGAFGGTSVTGRDIGASVLLSSGTGTGQISLSSGTVTVGTNNDKTGYTASTVSDKTGYSIADSTSDAVIADAVWNALTASYGSANTYGALLESGNVGGGAIVAASVAGNVGGNVAGSVASVATGGISSASFAAGAITAAAIAADAIGAAELAADAVAEIADAVWDEAISGHLAAGSTGNALNAAGSAGDPWSTPLPGAYGAGTAGKIVGDNVNATISSRSSHSAADVLTALGTGTWATAIPWNAAWDAEVQSECTDALDAYDPPTNAEMVAAIPTAVANADALLGRNIAGGSSTGRTVKQALSKLRNKWAISAGTLTVYDTDDATPLYTETLTSDAAGEPITASDPTT